jgi:catechol 2,3-dioxygenase-like lactoylglutathione lyase family enzyme
MTLQRMDNVIIVVDDLEGAKASFVELGMELEDQTVVQGPWVDQTVGLNDVRADIATLHGCKCLSPRQRSSRGSVDGQSADRRRS